MFTMLSIGMLGLGLLAAAEPPARLSDGGPAPVEPTAAVRASESAEEKPWYIVKAYPKSWEPGLWVDELSWRDERVVKWIHDHATVITVDPEVDRETAATLNLDPKPPMILAFKNFKEFDRIDGYQPPTHLLLWLEGLEAGRRSVVHRRWTERTTYLPAREEERRARRAQAQEHLENGDLDGAAEAEIWVWQHSAFHTWQEFEFIGKLVDKSAAAKRRFEHLRDSESTNLRAEQVWGQDLYDWLALNRLLGDEVTTLKWFDSVKRDRRMLPLFDRLDASPLFETLVAEGKWADVGRIIPDPMFVLEQFAWMARTIFAKPDPEGKHAEFRARTLEFMLGEVGLTYAGMLGSGRERLARLFAAKARAYFGAERTGVVLARWALEAGEVRPVHLQWLSDDATDPGARALRRYVEKALREKQPDEVWC